MAIIGKRVEIKSGFHKGDWGIVQDCVDGEYYIAMFGDTNVCPVFGRDEFVVRRSTTKKMTVNDFKAALEASGLSFDTFGWEGILNLICCEEGYRAKEMYSYGLPNAARGAERIKDAIYAILEKRGYYNDI